jgi:hypothetical protein
MNAKEMLLKIKGLFEAPIVAPTPIEAPVTAAVAPIPTPFKLQDGTDIMIGIDDPTVSMLPDAGDAVTIAGAPAPAGDYTLDDGTMLTVDATGVITLAVMPQPVTQPAFVEPPAKTLEERISALEIKSNTPAAMVTDVPEVVKTQMESQKNELADAKAKIEKQDGVIAGLFELIEKLVDEPTAEPATLSGNKKMQFERANNKATRLQGIASAMKEIKVLS